MNSRYLTLGIFVAVTLGALTLLAWTLGALPQSGKHYRVRLADAAGLVQGNAVRIAGVQIGQIRKIYVEGNQAVLDLQIDASTAVYTDACASPQMKGLLGEKFLQLRQGPTGSPLPGGSDIACIDASVDIGEALNAMNEVVDGEDGLYKPISRIVRRVDRLSEALDGEGLPRERLDKVLADVESMVGTTRAMLEENREDLRAITRRTRELLEDPRIDRMLTNGDKLLAMLEREAPGMLAQLDRILGKGEELVDDLKKATSTLLDGAHIKKLDDMMTDGQAAVKNLRKISDDFRDVAKLAKPMLDHLSVIVRRAAAIDEAAIRNLLQKEGFRVRLAVPYGVRGRLKELEQAEK